MTDMLIRTARTEDAEDILRLAHELARALGDDPDLLSLADVRTHMVGSSSDMTVLIAEVGGQVAGFIALLPSFETSHGSAGLYVSDFVVSEAHRRRGIGRILLASAARHARSRGLGHLWWTTMADNARARALYDDVADICEPMIAYAATGDAFARLAEAGHIADADDTSQGDTQ